MDNVGKIIGDMKILKKLGYKTIKEFTRGSVTAIIHNSGNQRG